ncbi:hypothetical protein GCM10010411_38880 [Actinomadura fulvescens]|uniref:Uncharacterized protein n=1 Tax=Actinomadura fulvescens TaxID=46160 RepID=A0ABN3PT52_9ACTN
MNLERSDWCPGTRPQAPAGPGLSIIKAAPNVIATPLARISHAWSPFALPRIGTDRNKWPIVIMQVAIGGNKSPTPPAADARGAPYSAFLIIRRSRREIEDL